jgi:hypothetical protein
LEFEMSIIGRQIESDFRFGGKAADHLILGRRHSASWLSGPNIREPAAPARSPMMVRSIKYALVELLAMRQNVGDDGDADRAASVARGVHQGRGLVGLGLCNAVAGCGHDRNEDQRGSAD